MDAIIAYIVLTFFLVKRYLAKNGATIKNPGRCFGLSVAVALVGFFLTTLLVGSFDYMAWIPRVFFMYFGYSLMSLIIWAIYQSNAERDENAEDSGEYKVAVIVLIIIISVLFVIRLASEADTADALAYLESMALI